MIASAIVSRRRARLRRSARLDRLPDDGLADIRHECVRHFNCTVSLLVVLYNRHENTRHRDRGVIERVRVQQLTLSVTVTDIEATRLEIME